MKYYVLLPQDEGVGGATRLLSMAIDPALGLGAARLSLGLSRPVQPWLIAELLLLRREMPRSLISCYDQITRYLELIAEAYGGDRGECHRLAGEAHARLRYGKIQKIFQGGLHEFLTDFIDR